jgi:hypothetical protein
MRTFAVSKKLHTLLAASNALWQKRARNITTASIFACLCAASLNKKGLRHIIDEDNSNFTAQALGRSRSSLHQNLFQDINRSIQQPHQEGP